MRTIELAGTGQTTTRLGFGGSALMGSISRSDSLRLLAIAYEAGFRHFDTAPLYGFGESEGCLGEFAAAHRDVTIATKFGLLGPKERGLLRLARRVAVPLVKKIPGLKRRLSAAAATMTGPIERPALSAGAAQASLERSLTHLRRERIEVWLLHEAEARDLVDEGLLRFLEDAVAQGKVGTFGIGSDSGKIGALLRERPAYCRVLQFEWSVFDPALQTGEPFRIHHRALNESFRDLHAALLADAEVAARWSREVGHDVRKRSVLAELMLKASLVMNPESVVLVSSRVPEHLRGNFGVLENDGLQDGARRLHALVLREGRSLLQRESTVQV